MEDLYQGCEIKDQDVGEGWVAKPWKLLFFAKLIMLVSVTLLVSFCVNIFVVSFVYIFSFPRFKIYCLENWLTSLKDFFFWGGGEENFLYSVSPTNYTGCPTMVL